MQEKLHELLESVGILQKTEELNPFLAGKVIEENGREMVEFESMLYKPGGSLYKGYLDRTYKLLRLRFFGVEGRVREETRRYFEQNHLGLIIDSRMSLMIPPVLYSHYGDFHLQCEQTSADYRIPSEREHFEFSAYTHNMLANCLSIGQISLDKFRLNCLSYITILDSNNRPDLEAMSRAFQRDHHNYQFQRDDIVKRKYPLEQRDDDKTRRNSLYLVRELRSDLKPCSTIPWMNKTFIELSEEKHGCQFIPPDAYIVEVLPIAKEYASSRKGKKINPSYSSQSIFFMSHQLELVTSDAPAVMQSFCLPELIYKIHLSQMALRLNDKFRPSQVGSGTGVVHTKPAHQRENNKQNEDHAGGVLETNLGKDEVAQVETSEPTLHFDRNTKPLRTSPRDLALIEALTQQRAQEPYSLEGLENMGDSYLKYVTSVILFKLLVDSDQGVLTSARSHLISNKNFNYLARKNSLGSFAIWRSFDKQVLCDLLNGMTRADYVKLTSKELADIFESLVGAHLVYGCEYEATRAIKTMGLDIFKDGDFSEWHPNAVTFSRCPSALSEDATGELTAKFSCSKDRLKGLESILGYKFNDPSYLVEAMTHASYSHRCTGSYERLEFLGDAILDFLVTCTLYATGKFDNPGQMTSSRSQLVNNVNFARISINFRFDLFILFANHEMNQQLTRLMQAIDDDLELDMSEFDQIVKLLGDIFESIAAAIYLDSGCSLDTVWGIFYPMLKETIDKEIESPTKNKLALLYETFTGPGHIEFRYKRDAQGRHLAECVVVDYKTFDGKGSSKSQARIRAVEETLRNIPSEEKLERINHKFLQAHPPVVRPPRASRRG